MNGCEEIMKIYAVNDNSEDFYGEKDRSRCESLRLITSLMS